jgi:hypothetical protein
MEEYLCNIPYQWRKEISKAICASVSEQQSLDCEAVQNCETVTTLSAFSVVGTQVCVTFTDEDKVSFTRCFNWQDIQNSTLDDVDPNCITSQEAWDGMTFTERIQAIIDYACTCVEITTTTTTTTTTSTTTTTTVEPTTTTTSTTTTTTEEPTTTTSTTTTTTL